MRKVLLLIGSLLFLSKMAMAEVNFGQIELPELVKIEVENAIKNNCPKMYEREFIPITYSATVTEGGITEYFLSSKDRGYVVNDPFWDFDVVVKYYAYQNAIFGAEFINRGDCW